MRVSHWGLWDMLGGWSTSLSYCCLPSAPFRWRLLPAV